MLTFLKILQKKKTTKFKEHLPQKIIERFGVETSIRKVKEALDRIPRRDDAVQKHLQPFVHKLKSKQEKKKKGEVTLWGVLMSDVYRQSVVGPSFYHKKHCFYSLTS